MIVRSLFLACILAVAGHRDASAEPTSPQHATETLQAARTALEDRDFALMETLSRSVVRADNFGNLPEALRQTAWRLLGIALVAQDQCDEGLPIFERLASAPGAGEPQLSELYNASVSCHDDERAASTLPAILQRHPALLSTFNEEILVVVAERSSDAALLSSLVNGVWRPQTTVELAPLRLRLARLYLAQGRRDLAAEAAQALIVNGASDPGFVVMLFVDKTFDPITHADPETFDFDRIMEWQLNNARQRVAAAPTELKALNALATALFTRNRLDEAGILLDEALERVETAGTDAPAFEDQADNINWTHDIKSRVQDASGDDAAALASLTQGAEELEQGAPNVSQRLNLAATLVELGRGADALNQLREFDTTNTSPYGLMVYHYILVCASVQTNDVARAQVEFTYMREHDEDSLNNLQDAALCLNDVPFAARTFIRRLNSQFDRRGALLDVQHFIGDRSVSQHQTDMRQRRNTIYERHDVQAAITRVGRVRSFPIRRPSL